MPLRARLARFRDFRRSLGTGRALRLLPVWLLRRELAVLVLDMAATPLPPAPEVVIDWERLGPADVPLLLALDAGLRSTDLRRRFAAGEEWWLARRGGEPVHFRAYATGLVDLPYLGRPLRLDENDVLLGTAYTVPAARRGGVLAAAAHWSQRYARARGHRRMVALIAAWNEAPRRVAERTGFVEIGRVGCWCLGPWRFGFFARGEVRFETGGALRLAAPSPPASG